jgi:hypothetical protein
MACRRASFFSLAFLRSSASMCCLDVGAAASSALHSGQRLANPGLSGFSSNSSSQMAQILIGKAIRLIIRRLEPSAKLWMWVPQVSPGCPRSRRFCETWEPENGTQRTEPEVGTTQQNDVTTQRERSIPSGNSQVCQKPVCQKPVWQNRSNLGAPKFGLERHSLVLSDDSQLPIQCYS